LLSHSVTAAVTTAKAWGESPERIRSHSATVFMSNPPNWYLCLQLPALTRVLNLQINKDIMTQTVYLVKPFMVEYYHVTLEVCGLMYTEAKMFKSNFDQLRRNKEARENRDLPLAKIAEETGLSTATIQRVKRSEVDNVRLSTLHTLCAYFGARRIGDLVEYYPDVSETA
jgi:DNA-binding Xre family transcriptional regulator